MQLAPPGHIGATRVQLKVILDKVNKEHQAVLGRNAGIIPKRGRPQPWSHAHHRIQHTPEAKAKMSQRRREWWARKRG